MVALLIFEVIGISKHYTWGMDGLTCAPPLDYKTPGGKSHVFLLSIVITIIR